ncbi:hypothetical protein ACFE04_020257 [Oxalis oulophora]
MVAKKISVPEDSCVIDMTNFTSSYNNNNNNNNTNNNNNNNTKDATANSRIKKSLSRKGSLRLGGEKKSNGVTNANESFSKGSSTPEKAATLAGVGPADQQTQVHHQITVTTTNSNITASSTAAENRFGLRRNSFKRSSSTWAVDPKRVLLFFATVSSMGTILLIYFTLSVGKFNVDDQPLE